MLVLSRRLNQRILIETPLGRIELTVVEIRDGHVRLGFVAPRRISISRDDCIKGPRGQKCRPTPQAAGCRREEH